MLYLLLLKPIASIIPLEILKPSVNISAPETDQLFLPSIEYLLISSSPQIIKQLSYSIQNTPKQVAWSTLRTHINSSVGIFKVVTKNHVRQFSRGSS